ncbi:GTPase IMAP family member 8-like [Ruditapes philippinarum]|uniref:GTPase IMAP family member 8-like n=1 Tax=Ruditapes philippinarum TaxID=129788 RepID=UPI00295AD8FB|nr:GTPase IMAP family member 8-like [Ruditapes philippinarum]
MDRYIRKLIVVGENGNGKSSTCNTLLEKEIFVGANRARTARCETCFIHMGSVNVWLVDSPGMFEPNSVLAERALEIQNAVTECKEPHAFLIVFKADAQTDERIMQTVDMLRLIFGQQVMKHAIIVITNAARFRSDADFQKFYQNGKLKEIVKMCKGRIVKLENIRCSPERKKDMVDDIFAVVDKVSRMGKHCFRNSDLDCHKQMLEQHLVQVDASKPINEQIELMKKRLREQLPLQQGESGYYDVVDGH